MMPDLTRSVNWPDAASYPWLKSLSSSACAARRKHALLATAPPPPPPQHVARSARPGAAASHASATGEASAAEAAAAAHLADDDGALHAGVAGNGLHRHAQRVLRASATRTHAQLRQVRATPTLGPSRDVSRRVRARPPHHSVGRGGVAPG